MGCHTQTLAAAVGLTPGSTGSGTNLSRTITPRFRIQVHQLARCTLCVRTRLSVYACYTQHDAPNDDDPTPVPNNGTRDVTSMSMDLSSPSGTGESEYATVGDSALDCFIGCIKEIATKRTEIILRRKLPRLFMKYPDYRLALGFGLHHGWAIEGSLGAFC